ncbi:MAG: hypothetical protein GY716_08915 [bacterium]|nr:hypothetical protein [bacterium]
MTRSAHVIGMGEVGRRVHDALVSRDWTVRPVTRDAGWNATERIDDDAVRIVAVREEGLAGVLARLDPRLAPRTILLQNGFLEPNHDDVDEYARGLIWFTSKREFFEVLQPSIFHGECARPVVEALNAAGIAAEYTDERANFLREMIVKCVWNAVVGLPLAVHEINLGAYLSGRRAELEALVAESAHAASVHYGVDVDPTLCLDRIEATTATLHWVRGSAKALAWRAGAIASFGRRHGVPTPVTDRLLLETESSS